MKTYRTAAIPGDGIGKEVMPEGVRALDAAARRFGFAFDWDWISWASCDYYAQHGRMMPEDWFERIAGHDAVYFGAVGWPATVPDHISLWGSLIQFRRRFDLYVNIRPARLMPGMKSPLADRVPGDIDMYIVRENTEGEYSNAGGRLFEGTERELAMQETVMTRHGVDRVLKYAFELASKRPKKHLTSATKSNGISITMPYWDERVKAMAAQYPEVRVDQYHIDILCANFVQHPDWFDVVVGSNLFGDILSDLGPACTGTIGIAPSANLNPERIYPSVFEPVHGSAPDIAGRNIANPLGQIWSGVLMLEHLGQPQAAAAVMQAIERVLTDGPKTRDLGGTANTLDVGKAVAEIVAASEEDTMKKLLLALLLSATGLVHAAIDVAGVKFEDKSKLGATELQINGAGKRSKFILKVYAVGLYLTEKKTAAADVLTLKGAKRLRIVTLRDLTAEQFVDALVEGIHKNHSDVEMEALKTRIEEFKAIMLAVKKAAEGTVVDIDWLPESGTRLSISGKQQGQDIAGEDFYHALLKIWLGGKPAQDDLKEALLGKAQ